MWRVEHRANFFMTQQYIYSRNKIARETGMYIGFSKPMASTVNAFSGWASCASVSRVRPISHLKADWHLKRTIDIDKFLERFLHYIARDLSISILIQPCSIEVNIWLEGNDLGSKACRLWLFLLSSGVSLCRCSVENISRQDEQKSMEWTIGATEKTADCVSVKETDKSLISRWRIVLVDVCFCSLDFLWAEDWLKLEIIEDAGSWKLKSTRSRLRR